MYDHLLPLHKKTVHLYIMYIYNILVKVISSYITGNSVLGMCLEGIITHSALLSALSSRHIPRTLFPVMYEDMWYFNWFIVEYGAIQKTALAQEQQAESVVSHDLQPIMYIP